MNQLLTFYPNRIIIIRKWCEVPSFILWDVSERNLYYGEQCYYSCRRTGQENEDQYAKGFVQCYRRAMLEWVLTACENAELDDICVVKGYEVSR